MALRYEFGAIWTESTSHLNGALLFVAAVAGKTFGRVRHRTYLWAWFLQSPLACLLFTVCCRRISHSSHDAKKGSASLDRARVFGIRGGTSAPRLFFLRHGRCSDYLGKTA